MKKTDAFTLAEVLITLMIIGIVAAITLPAIIQNNKKRIIETKLQKIYSVMNNAIRLSEIENGSKNNWQYCNSNNGSCKSFFEKYFFPYIPITKTEEFESIGRYNIAMYLNDGTVLVAKNANDVDFFFFVNAKDFNSKTFGSISEDGKPIRKDVGKKYFAFRFAPAQTTPQDKFHTNNGFEPYKYELQNFTKEELTGSYKYACNKTSEIPNWCTALIQLNNWKIPDDYPFRF